MRQKEYQMSESDFMSYVQNLARDVKAPDFKLTGLQKYRYECILLDEFIKRFKEKERTENEKLQNRRNR